MNNIYEQLRETLDRYGIGFPSVPGVDVAYLKGIFTEEHARVFVAMENRFQLATEIAERLNQNPDDIKTILDIMADKGLVMTSTKTEPTFYAPLPWLTGWGDWTAFWEDEKTALLEQEYRKGFRQKMKGSNYKRNIFRTVPVYETIPDKSTVAPYDDIRKIIERADSISVADCYCDAHRKKQGQHTTEPLERCFLFGVYADYLIEKGFGRRLSKEEAMAILTKCEDAGLVHNVTDLENPIFICNCPEYCGSNIARRVAPSPFAISPRIHNYVASVNTDQCSGCEACLESCNLKAISMGQQGVAQINGETCVGCGVCVTKCPAEALTLKERAESERYAPVVTHPNVRSSEEYEADLERYKDIIKFRAMTPEEDKER
jgi:Na+-translocating ferredoxin:NAD+ oxidoreductase subunit B